MLKLIKKKPPSLAVFRNLVGSFSVRLPFFHRRWLGIAKVKKEKETCKFHLYWQFKFGALYAISNWDAGLLFRGIHHKRNL